MTSFERAVVAAYLARREHGEGSWQYAEALTAMEREKWRTETPPEAPRVDVSGHPDGKRQCGCWRFGRHKDNCTAKEGLR